MKAKALKDYLTADDGHEIWSVADELRVLIRDSKQSGMVPASSLKVLAFRLERLARITDQQQVPLELTGVGVPS